MKNTLNIFFTAAGLINGAIFLFNGSLSASSTLLLLGVFLTSLGLLAGLDLRRSLRPARTTSLVPFAGLQDKIHYHGQRLHSMYQLYHMSHDVLKAQIDLRVQVQQLKMQLLESATDQTQTSLALPEKIGPLLIAHADSINGDIKSAFEANHLKDRIGDTNAIIVTDMGYGGFNSEYLDQILAGDVEPDFWVAKKALGGHDLFVLPNHLATEHPRSTSALLDLLGKRYEKVVGLFSNEAIATLKEEAIPSNQKILNARSSRARLDSI
jgi:hypothetical protein